MGELGWQGPIHLSFVLDDEVEASKVDGCYGGLDDIMTGQPKPREKTSKALHVVLIVSVYI